MEIRTTSVLLGWRTNLLFALFMVVFGTPIAFLLLVTGTISMTHILMMTLGVVALAAFLSVSVLAVWARIFDRNQAEPLRVRI